MISRTKFLTFIYEVKKETTIEHVIKSPKTSKIDLELDTSNLGVARYL